MRIYEELAKVYDKEWGKFSLSYLKYVEYLKSNYLFEPTAVLDVACGTGELITELNKLGYTVRGIDISDTMISVAKNRSNEIDFIVDDMISYKSDRKFDLVICAFDAVNYLLLESQIISTFNLIKEALYEDGYFIFDFNTPTLYREKHYGTINRNIDNIKFLQELEYNEKENIATTIFDFGNKRIEEHIQRGYSIEKMDELLSRVGLKVMAKFKDFKFTPADEMTHKAFYVVMKDKDIGY